MGAQYTSLNFYLLVVLDCLLIVGAHWLAYLTRFEGSIPPDHFQKFLNLVPYFAAIKMGCFFYFDLYRGMWRYTSLPDIFNIFKSVLTASLIMMSVLLFSRSFQGFSRSVFVLDIVYATIFITGLRVGIRMVYGIGWVRLPDIFGFRPNTVKSKYILLGAGKAAEKMVREIQSNPSSTIQLAAVFDDDASKHGRLLHGLPVVGPIDALPTWMRNVKYPIKEALIAMPSISGSKFREVVSLCEQAGLPYKTIPSLSEIADGKVSLKALRDVDYKDLLTRETVHLDMAQISKYLEGKTVLVTGAGGSIGSELCRQVLSFKPKLLLLLDSSEHNLYTIQMELEHERSFPNYVPLLGNLQDEHWLDYVLRTYKPSQVFHAAAYKHVPMLEANPWQAVYNNVVATANLIRAGIQHSVEGLLVVSTDKAVRPTNVMGASKRLTEKIMQAYCNRGTRLMAVRFGNVVGSAGSVIPLFRRQIERGGPVTVTHPEVVRYFMTVEEAVQLILQAGSMGGDGEIFVLKMGQPVKIAEMAEDLIRLSGKEPGNDVEIRFIGLRPGEKLFEELITEDEGIVPTEHSKILVLRGEGCTQKDYEPFLHDLVKAADDKNAQEIRRILHAIIPEYTS